MVSLCSGLSAFYRRTVRAAAAVVISWLFVSSLVFRNFIAIDEHSWLTPNATILQCLFFCLTCFLCLRPASLRHPNSLPRRVRLISILCAVLLTGLWVCRTWSAPIGDAMMTQHAAEIIHQGFYTLYEPGEYMYFYPHQSGLVLLHWLLQFISPDDTKLFLFLNVLCYGIILWGIGALTKALGMGEGSALAATWSSILFYPLALYTVFVYGTLPGLAFALVGLLMVIGYCEKGKLWRCLLGAAAFGIAIALKSNYQIFAIGAMLYTLYHALQREKRCWIQLLLLCTAFAAAGKIPVLLLEHLTGYSLRSGLPYTGWICMGLQSNGALGPGWYNNYVREGYYAAGGDPQAHRAMIQEDLRGILTFFAHHPRQARVFFFEKNATQWNDPTFQGLWINQIIAESNGTVLPRFAEKLLSPASQITLTRLGSCFLTFVYGGLLLWAWNPSPEKRHSSEDLLAVILVGGFVFHSFWEAKSQYTMPYFVTALPLALQGYRRLSRHPSRNQGVVFGRCAPIERLRRLAPIVLMLLALVLSLCLPPQYTQNLRDYLTGAA